MSALQDIEFLPNKERQTRNLALIKKAFYEGFKIGIEFMHEAEDTTANAWRRRAWNEFVEKNKIKK